MDCRQELKRLLGSQQSRKFGPKDGNATGELASMLGIDRSWLSEILQFDDSEIEKVRKEGAIKSVASVELDTLQILSLPHKNYYGG